MCKCKVLETINPNLLFCEIGISFKHRTNFICSISRLMILKFEWYEGLRKTISLKCSGWVQIHCQIPADKVWSDRMSDRYTISLVLFSDECQKQTSQALFRTMQFLIIEY